MKWRFEDRISKQMEAIKKVIVLCLLISLGPNVFLSSLVVMQGINDVITLNALKVFDEREMEVSGGRLNFYMSGVQAVSVCVLVGYQFLCGLKQSPRIALSFFVSKL